MAIRSLLEVAAPAKLNLFLHVVGRRADGYHLLESVFALIDWQDTLHFERRDDGRLVRHDLTTALPADDLCLRAARLLQQESGSRCGADISLDKQVPWGAGLGGGSSDAATTLLALNRLWGLRWPRARLQALGLRLGADVPFFVGGCNAFVEGVGERLTPLELPAQRFAVVKPPMAVATADVFERLRLEPAMAAGIVTGFSDGGPLAMRASFEADAGFGRNDLERPAAAQCPQVAEALAWLAGRFGNSRMTGSGSAVFAREPSMRNDGADTDTAKHVGQGGERARIDTGTNIVPIAFDPAALPPGWTGRSCQSLPEHPLRAWAD